jgi:dynein heavy chain
MARWQENMTGQILKASENKSVLREEQTWYLKLMMNMVEITRGDLNLLQRTLICALMVLDVHARDVIELLAHENVCTIDDF